MSLSNLLSAIKSQNVQRRQDALLELRKRSKSGGDIAHLHDLECGSTLLDILEEENGKYYIVVLSIFANWTNINENWRQLVSFLDSLHSKLFLSNLIELESMFTSYKLWSMLNHFQNWMSQEIRKKLPTTFQHVFSQKIFFIIIIYNF